MPDQLPVTTKFSAAERPYLYLTLIELVEKFHQADTSLTRLRTRGDATAARASNTTAVALDTKLAGMAKEGGAKTRRSLGSACLALGSSLCYFGSALFFQLVGPPFSVVVPLVALPLTGARIFKLGAEVGATLRAIQDGFAAQAKSKLLRQRFGADFDKPRPTKDVTNDNPSTAERAQQIFEDQVSEVFVELRARSKSWMLGSTARGGVEQTLIRNALTEATGSTGPYASTVIGAIESGIVQLNKSDYALVMSTPTSVAGNSLVP